MAKKTTAKERMVGEEDSEILHITSTISEMEISDSKHSRNAKDEVVNIESEFPKTSPRDQTTNIQQLKSFVDDEKVSELDQDQDQTHPAYIPRIGQFFMHDTRETCERITPHLLSRADCKWRHDLYNEIDQIPISNQEFAKKYGVDREGNPISSTRIRTSTNVWNASRCFARTHKSVKKQENSNRLSFVGNILNEEHSSVWENKKLDGGKEAESKSETHNTYNNRAKMEMRLGKRYSTQRPIKSFEM
ncbi:hypothetical protein WUBG_08952 [Wuchereria bancrofti]|uniref:Protein CASC3 n=1 Tax=Wuchereria bancrofti TaxID=6293 RepID=J9EYA5_WUCBA|nr:hypothetical protein WUBG_08952 [Wuchereria bancrofti]